MIKATAYVLAGFALALAFLVAIGAALGCAPTSPTPVRQVDVAGYAAEQLDCVKLAVQHDGGLAEAKACIAVVRARYCGDGGSLVGYCAGQDGGAK